ncbi:YciI family protein [Actinopolymorpha sp. NPDC004070]|uniref:YciI family protein n=1 Tax=Actinopolymorpha sp. NPDC004070 TaxID=3154548 RepID=UPI0033A77917
MKFMMLVCWAEDDELGPDESAAMRRDSIAWMEQMDARGVRLQGHRLRPAADARTVRVRADDVLVVDGPFAETKEQIAGYDLLECADLDEAVEVASKHPVARFGAIEVRPYWE